MFATFLVAPRTRCKLHPKKNRLRTTQEIQFIISFLLEKPISSVQVLINS